MRAQQAADTGRQEHAKQALRAYDTHAPDNPLADLRATVARSMAASRAAQSVVKDAGRAEDGAAKNKAMPRLEREEVQR
jgi:hypothetical protein